MVCAFFLGYHLEIYYCVVRCVGLYSMSSGTSISEKEIKCKSFAIYSIPNTKNVDYNKSVVVVVVVGFFVSF